MLQCRDVTFEEFEYKRQIIRVIVVQQDESVIIGFALVLLRLVSDFVDVVLDILADAHTDVGTVVLKGTGEGLQERAVQEGQVLRDRVPVAEMTLVKFYMLYVHCVSQVVEQQGFQSGGRL